MVPGYQWIVDKPRDGDGVTSASAATASPVPSAAPGTAAFAKRPGAVKAWAVIGAGALTVIVVGITRWLASDERVSTDPGADHYPYLAVLRTIEIASAAMLLALLYVLVISPGLRDRRFGFDGMLLISCLLVHFIDPVFNYFSPSFIQNSHSVQWGSWANFIPGYASPSGTAGFVEGLLWAAALYGLFGVVAAIGGCAILARLRSRLPGLSNFGHYAILFAVFGVLDFVIENIFVRAQIYIFWGAYSGLTLWPGQIYQFPLYETLFAVIYALGFVWLRDSRDERGISAVERGADKLGALQRFTTAIRFLALTGFCLVWGMISYFMPFAWMSMMSDSYPPLPSYLHGGAFCGLEDKQPCPAEYLRELKLNYRSIGQP